MTLDLKRLRELANAATPGPWEFERVSFDDGEFSYERNDKHGFISISEMNYRSPMKAKFDADFIAAFNPATAIELLDRI